MTASPVTTVEASEALPARDPLFTVEPKPGTTDVWVISNQSRGLREELEGTERQAISRARFMTALHLRMRQHRDAE